MQVEVVHSLCRQCGLPDKGSKLECVLRLQKQFVISCFCNINMSIIIIIIMVFNWLLDKIMLTLP